MLAGEGIQSTATGSSFDGAHALGSFIGQTVTEKRTLYDLQKTMDELSIEQFMEDWNKSQADFEQILANNKPTITSPGNPSELLLSGSELPGYVGRVLYDNSERESVGKVMLEENKFNKSQSYNKMEGELKSQIEEINYKKLLRTVNFKIYLSTIYGEACSQSIDAWRAVANVINNRVGYREWSKYKTQISIIKNTGFDAYSQRTKQYNYAYNTLSSGKLDLKLLKMMRIIAPIYLHLSEDTTNGAVLYYSPKAQATLAAHSKHYRITPNWNVIGHP